MSWFGGLKFGDHVINLTCPCNLQQHKQATNGQTGIAILTKAVLTGPTFSDTSKGHRGSIRLS